MSPRVIIRILLDRGLNSHIHQCRGCPNNIIVNFCHCEGMPQPVFKGIVLDPGLNSQISLTVRMVSVVHTFFVNVYICFLGRDVATCFHRDVFVDENSMSSMVDSCC